MWVWESKRRQEKKLVKQLKGWDAVSTTHTCFLPAPWKLHQWDYVNFPNNGDFVHIFWWILMDPELIRTGYFDTVHTSRISINASLHLQNEAWQQQRPDMNKQQCYQQEVFFGVRRQGFAWMKGQMSARTYMSNVCVVSGLSKVSCMTTIYCSNISTLYVCNNWTSL